jgi:hypothetical protein
MKRSILLVLLILTIAIPSIAKDKSITLTWTQTIPAQNDLSGWNIYYSETTGGPYKLLTFVFFRGVQATYSYEGKRVIDKIGNKKGDIYFMIRAVDEAGNLSPPSVEVQLKNVDGTLPSDTTPPTAPGNVSAGKK